VLKDGTGKKLADIKAPVAQAKIGYLVGSDLNRHIVHDPREAIPNQGSTDCEKLRVTETSDYRRLHVTKGYYRQGFRYKLDNYDTLLNLVTDPDQHPRVLRNMVRMLDGYAGRVINHPAMVLRTGREHVARQIGQTGFVHAPKVARLAATSAAIVRQTLEKAGLVFPALVRAPGTHGGNFLGLYDDVDALTRSLQPKQEYTVTEFVDFRSDDGLYRKYRMFFFGSQRIFRHMLVADHWNVHANNGNHFMVERPTLTEEESRLFASNGDGLGPAVIAALVNIREEIGLDFMGIDFGFTREGKLLLFEANATMNFFPFFDDERVSYRKTCVAGAQRGFESLIGLQSA
jgi:hypothetical protein